MFIEKLEKLREANRKLLNSKTRYLLRSKYSGKGRPRNEDYVIVKIKDIPDIQAFEILSNGFTTSYTSPSYPLIQS